MRIIDAFCCAKLFAILEAERTPIDYQKAIFKFASNILERLRTMYYGRGNPDLLMIFELTRIYLVIREIRVPPIVESRLTTQADEDTYEWIRRNETQEKHSDRQSPKSKDHSDNALLRESTDLVGP